VTAVPSPESRRLTNGVVELHVRVRGKIPALL
jgi:hypothetical protein